MAKETGGNNITELVEKYNLSIKEASPQLYDIYISLYVKGNTQEGAAEEMLYSSFYVYMKVGQEEKKLLLFDDFKCIDEGCIVGTVSEEIIKQMPKSN